MSENRPFVLTIAGFDPSAGAGVLADVKTFEQHRVYGLAIHTGNTIQTENEFYDIQWTDLDFVLKSITILFKKYIVNAVKIGITPNLDYLKEIVFLIKELSSETKIVWDPVLKSTTDFNFLTIENQFTLIEILKKIDLITPNYHEILQLTAGENTAEKVAVTLTKYCSILLKGGHNPSEKGTDYLYLSNSVIAIQPTTNFISQKHGSGCVLSSAIGANWALSNDLIVSCQKAKKYTENYLKSSINLLGYHHV